ncbi:MAG: protein kinase [Anaerolineae bacterium]
MADDSRKIGGRYILGEQIGRGGMATVYRAHDPQFGRDVALKMLHAMPGDEQDQFLVRKFQQEAKIIASLEHYAIVPVYDYGSHKDWPYLVMRLMDGGTLKDSIQQGPLPLAEIQIVLQRICAALDRAHSKNVVHRDIKPTNVFMDEDGLVYLGDFGIARLTKGDQTTSYLGSPRYMAPEQAQGELLGPATDIYQMGVVLFEMLTGQKPYSGETTEQTILMHLQAPIPRPTDLNPDLPLGMDSVIELAMAKDPAERLQAASDLVDAFQHALRSPLARDEYDYDEAYEAPITQPAVRVPEFVPEETGHGINRRPFFLEDDPVDESWPPRETASGQTFLQKNGLAIGVGILALLILLCGGSYLATRAFGLVGPVPTRAVIAPAPTPIDDAIVESGESDQEDIIEPTVEEGEAEPVATATLPPVEKLLLDSAEIGQLGGGTGRMVFAAERESGFEIFVSSGDGVEQLTNNTQDDYGPVFSPDGRQIAWHAQHPSQKTWEIFIANVDGSGVRNLTQNGADDSFPKWSPDGSKIVFHSNRNNRQFDIFVINATGGETTQLTSSEQNEFGPVFSPDGSRIAFHRRLTRNTSELFIMNPDGTGEVQMTQIGRLSEFISWSPDGELLVFHAFVDEFWQLFTADPTTGNATQLTFDARNSFYPKWSPNGEWINFHTEIDEGNRELFLVSKDGSQMRRLTDSAEQERMPDWQP